ncbi:unnamed protein product [Orchesella dallaii]|uniref:Uncharacterized protein n=1 Tax=Orchesella dallaii TaxID=48710 RepID=A0ABP1QHU1_9HEXA
MGCGASKKEQKNIVSKPPRGLFGSAPGVIRTRVGFSGGSTQDPTYRRLYF